MHDLFRVPQRRGRLLLVGSGIMALVLLASVLAFLPYSGFQAHAATPTNTPGKGKQLVYEDPVTHEQDTVTAEGDDGNNHLGANVDLPAGAGLGPQHISMQLDEGAGPSSVASPLGASFSRSGTSAEAPTETQVASENQVDAVDAIGAQLSSAVQDFYYRDGYRTYEAPGNGIQYTIQVRDRAVGRMRTLHVLETSNNRLRLNQFRNRVDDLRRNERSLLMSAGFVATAVAWIVGALEISGPTTDSAKTATAAAQNRYALLAAAAFIAGFTFIITGLWNIADIHQQLVGYYKELRQGDGDPHELGERPHQARRRLSAAEVAQAAQGTSTGSGNLPALAAGAQSKQVATASRPVLDNPSYSGYEATESTNINLINASWIVPCGNIRSTGKAESIISLGGIPAGTFAGTREDASDGYRFTWGVKTNKNTVYVRYPLRCNDSVDVSIATEAGGNYINIFMADYTQGFYVDVYTVGTIKSGLAFWLDGRYGYAGSPEPLLYDFQDVLWSHCGVRFTDGNVKTLGVLNYTKDRMVEGGKLLAYPGAITNDDSFTDYWVRA